MNCIRYFCGYALQDMHDHIQPQKGDDFSITKGYFAISDSRSLDNPYDNGNKID